MNLARGPETWWGHAQAWIIQYVNPVVHWLVVNGLMGVLLCVAALVIFAKMRRRR